MPLGYGTHADWYRNMVSAGTCTLAWKGHTYQLERPELVSGPEVMGSWPRLERIMLQLAGIHDFMWLHQPVDQAPVQTPEPAPEPTSVEPSPSALGS